MRFGIPSKSMGLIKDALIRRKEIEKAAIFGSRAIGNYKNGSDVDIVIYGIDITVEIVNQISVELNEKLPLPYYFDVVHYEGLKHEGLKKHIDKFGKVFYKR
ncbi:nucleotidyltransferase domain-containing protein [Crassaminicella indica]|uniref:Nucleotidyltransferase domain-containing protein n=1 Tax=Crassaminicella indica TaxID=2855394 RepID=A0ABX8RCC3_9CLOT|nr:nucleotidyltransferase domain-containing protein [Crassaminicella indica]QXM06663.1 nucleotidyltransferase domain-containing protein [Crassaminicella indica]